MKIFKIVIAMHTDSNNDRAIFSIPDPYERINK